MTKEMYSKIEELHFAITPQCKGHKCVRCLKTTRCKTYFKNDYLCAKCLRAYRKPHPLSTTA